MKLFASPASPFVRKALIVLQETGLRAQTEVILVSGTVLDPGSMPLDENPLGKIPTLLLNDGRALYDSRVITRFLDETAQSGLYPDDDRKWECLTLEALADGICDAAVLCVYEKRLRPESHWYDPWTDGQWAKVARALDRAEAAHLPFLDGDFTVAHAGMVAALGYLDFRHADRDWRQGHDGLARWFEGISARPSIASTAPTG